MTKRSIGIIVGSLRKESYSLKAGKIIAKLFPADYDVQFLSIDGLPFYNEDLEIEGHVPAPWQAFRDQIAPLDAFVFITPEYNRSVPAVIKNAVDVGSRPYGKNLWDGKPAVVVSTSIGNISGFGANHHLRQTLVFVNMPTLAQPEAYLGETGSMFNEDGSLKDAGTEKFLDSIVTAFIQLIDRYA